MKQLVGKRLFHTELRDCPVGTPAGNQALVRVKACGVCGTDLHILRQMQALTPMGHEIAGVVEAVGADVTRVRTGDNVVVEDTTRCGACEDCKRDMAHLCRSGYTLQGQSGMAELLLVHENMLNVYDGIDDYTTACMAEPLSVSIGAVQQARLPTYGTLAIFGMGAIGLFCAAYARHCGAQKVVMVANDPYSLRNRAASAVARELHADDVFYMKEEGALDRMLAVYGPFDAAISAAPPQTVRDALRVVKYGGSVVPVGVTFGTDNMVEVDVNDLVMHKKSILPFFAEPAQNFPLALSLIKNGVIDVGKAVTHRLPLTEHARLKELYGADAAAIKTVIVEAKQA